MAKEIIMPKFGFTQEESEILEWLHNEGDQVEKGDPIAVVSTDKISMEVEAPKNGILGGIRYQVGDVVPVTKVIAYVLQPGESVPEAEIEAKGKKKTTVSDKPEDQPAKSGMQVTPVAKKLLDSNQLDIKNVFEFAGKMKITRAVVESYLESNSKPESDKIRATPAARRLSREEKVDLNMVTGSGPKGRIQADDVQSAQFEKESAMEVVALTREEIPLNTIRKTIARNMTQSWQEIPQMTLQIDIPVSRMERYRQDINSTIDPKSKKITVTALIAKAVAKAIRKNRIVNSQLNGQKIILLEEINIGIATALEDGLIVPVVHHVDEKSVKVISNEIRDQSQRARNNKLQPEDLTDGTFTISNLGMFEIDRFTAIINPPQSAILAVGKKNRQLIPEEDNAFRVEEIITFTLSADHRVMDGVQAARFLADLKNIVQNVEALDQ